MQAFAPVLRDIVLIGGGHSHVGVLHHFAMHPAPGVRLTLICTDTDTPYSGMLPGYVAGHYRYDEVHIDLRRLAQFAGARYLNDTVTGIDRAARTVLCRNRPPQPYDVASINIGSTPRMTDVPGATEHAVPVKPIRQFNQRWLALLERVRALAAVRTDPLNLAVVGGGAGGVEMLLAMQYRLRNELRALGHDPGKLHFHLFHSGAQLLETHNRTVQALYRRVLTARGVHLHLNAQVRQVGPGRLLASSGLALEVDEVLWVTQAAGAPWLRDTGLELDAQGFIRVHDTLQTVTDPLLFAAGDVASLMSRPLEKAGVFAVRMGMPLAENLLHAVRDEPLHAFRPQRHWLSLISTGNRAAVASRGPFGLAGRWVWRWKDHIDRSFMRRFQDLQPMAAAPAASADTSQGALPANAIEADQARTLSTLAMRCGGCGAKVGSTVLARALSRLQPVARADVLVGLDGADDAAVLQVPAGKLLVHSVDFFRAFIDDPYRFGQIAANHALGDLYAMGAEPQSASAIVTVPPGIERKTEELLTQLMAGALQVLNEAGCALVGGHTGEGQELALGFAVNGLIDAQPTSTPLLRKSGLHPGDVLILTKPLGTGTLLAAHARLLARGRWIDAALDAMCLSNRDAVPVLRAHGVTACTDITGFGLLGHLLEMTRASGVDAELCLSALPLLEGAEAMAAAGVVSSLQPANLRLRRALYNADSFAGQARKRLLYDPQTAGGLLASVPADQAATCLNALHAAGYTQAAQIGQVLARSDRDAPIALVA